MRARASGSNLGLGRFEGIASEHGLEWRCADSLSLRDFLGLGLDQRVPDHSWLTRTRALVNGFLR